VANAVVKKNKLSYSEKREMDSLVSVLEALQNEKNRIELSLLAAEGDFETLHKMSEDLADINAKIDRSELRWLELSERDS
jgi:ATP-binding cassette subfamily F protein uup